MSINSFCTAKDIPVIGSNLFIIGIICSEEISKYNEPHRCSGLWSSVSRAEGMKFKDEAEVIVLGAGWLGQLCPECLPRRNIK